MSAPDLTDADVAAVLRVLRTPQLSLGPHLEAFERAFAVWVGEPHAVAVNSGTSGLHLCVLAVGVEADDLVITSPFSFVASANCILYERAVPIFVDVDPVTGNLDPAQVAECARDLRTGGRAAERWLPPTLRAAGTRDGRLKALLPVHAFGQPADMDALGAVARAHGLALIEDACEAVGAAYRGRPAGTLGDAAVFAFYPNKQMTTGEGGMIVTARADWDALFRSLRNQGRDVFDAWLNHSRLGYNYRLDEMSAALGLAQLQRLDELLAKRARVAAWYSEHLADVDGLEPPQLAETTTRMSWFVYVVRLHLAEAGYPSRPYFTPIHLQPFYARRFGYQPGAFPVTERLGECSLALPFSSLMREEQVEQVCRHLIEAIHETR